MLQLYLLWRDLESHFQRCTVVHQIDDSFSLAETMQNWSTCKLNDYSYGTYIDFGPVFEGVDLGNNAWNTGVFPCVTTVDKVAFFYIPMVSNGLLDPTDDYHIVLDDVPDFADAVFAHGTSQNGGAIFSIDAPFVELRASQWNIRNGFGPLYRCVSFWGNNDGRIRQYSHFQVDDSDSIVLSAQEYSTGVALGWIPMPCTLSDYDMYDSPTTTSVLDTARLQFRSTSGALVEFNLPGAPQEIWMPDYRHVDQSKIGGLIEDVLSHGCDAQGNSLVAFVRGLYRRHSQVAANAYYSA